MTPTVILHHFLRGPVLVQAENVDGRREWTCPNRPMMRAWDDGCFLESRAEIDTMLAQLVEGVGQPTGSAPGHGS